MALVGISGSGKSSVTQSAPPPSTRPTTAPTSYTYNAYHPHHTHLKLGARYYDPTTARFTQTDPAGQGPNPYTYTSDDPTNYIDPLGLWSWGDFGLASIGAMFVTAGAACVSGAVEGALAGPEGAAAGCTVGLIVSSGAGGLVAGAGSYMWLQATR